MRASFDDLLAPLDRAGFFGGYWERRHLFLHRGNPDAYGEIFALADIDRWLVAARPNPAHLLLIVPPAASGQRAERKALHEVDTAQLYGAFQAGCTLVLEEVEKSWPAVAELAATVGEALSARVWVNSYLTPPDAQGVPVHPDVQDVLVLQVAGRKDWSIYEMAGESCRETLTYRKQLRGPVAAAMAEPPLLERATLEQGDLLYIPRGLPHKAAAPAGSPSLHLTVCIEPLCWLDLLKAAVEVASVEQSPLARSLPPGFVADARARDGMAESFARMLSLFQEHVSFERTLETVIKAQVAGAHYPGDGHFAQLLRLSEVGAETWVERRTGLACLVERSPRSALISFAASQISGPLALAQAMEFVRDQLRFRVSQLPGGLSDEAKLVLVRRLIREGLLRADFTAGQPAPVLERESSHPNP